MGQGVLRQELTNWLTQAPLKRIVLAFTTAQPKHGGSGAVYLLLRQVRKDQGRIVWENIFTDLDG
jgi:DNA-nicking Smr family endonuclease